ncbi:hypothetical protein FACS1894170_00480 [Planctomycetales bacterium]|nr:hypothetical protein FACS1894170_00480 [Planctomycetales bacterium]
MGNLRREIAELKKLAAEQSSIILGLKARIAQLEKTRCNSSKPPVARQGGYTVNGFVKLTRSDVNPS